MTPPTRGPGLHLDPETMRALGYRVVDALVERWAGLSEDAAWVGADRDAIESRVPLDPPRKGRDPAAVLEHAIRDILPVAGRVDHPRFLAFIPSAPTWPGVLGDFLAAGYNVFQGTWLESAGPTLVELRVIDWIRTWIGYPEGASGLLTSGASAATLTALAAARIHADATTDPAPGGPAVYLSDQGHSSVQRAARAVGIPPGGVRVIPTDATHRLEPEALEAALHADRRRGMRPVAVVATAGTTNTGAVDPLGALAELCAREGVWLHVDAAYGGFARLTERGCRLLQGLDRADSVTLDPHKWLFQPYEAGCLMTRRAGVLEAAFRVMPDYLQDVDLGDAHVNFADRGLQLTRSFRALKVWMTVQTFGTDAMRDAMDHALDLTERAEAWIRAEPRLEIVTPASLGVLCYRVGSDGLPPDQADALQARVQDAVIRSGVAMLSSTRVDGRFTLRLCILNHATTWHDLEAVLTAVADAAERERASR